MKIFRNRWLGAGATLLAIVGLSGCWGDSNEDPAPPPVVDLSIVPDSAGASAATFNTYVKGLAIGDESAEPKTFNTTFTAPAEDTSEPDAVT